MHWLLAHLVTGAVLASGVIAPTDAGAPSADDRFRNAIHDYARLDKPGQARWLEDLFSQRAEPAARIALDIAGRQRQLDRHDAVLSHIREGRELSGAGLLQLIREIDQLESKAVGRLASEYQRITEAVLGQDPVEIKRRIQVWQSIQNRWRRAGGSWEQQPKLIRWLQIAITQERISPHPPLPSAPDFGVANRPALASRPRAPRSAGLAPQPSAPRTATSSERTQLSPRDVALSLPRDAPPASPGPNDFLPQSTTPAEVVIKPPPVTGQRREREVAKVVIPPTTQPKARSRPAGSTIDLNEFSARVTGYNMALADFVSRLHGKPDWDPAELEVLVDELGKLAMTRRDLDLYWKLLPLETRRGLAPIEPLQSPISLVAGKVAIARRQLAPKERGEATLDETRASFALDRVSHRLARLAVDE